MRAAVSVVFVGVMTFSRTNRPVTGEDSGTFVTSAVLPRICATVVKFVPSVETWMSASFVSQVADSPPAPALRRVKDLMENDWPRSTWRNLLVPSEHHLSLFPPETLPLNAFAGPSLALHIESAVAGLFSATLVGPVPPPLPYTSSS